MPLPPLSLALAALLIPAASAQTPSGPSDGSASPLPESVCTQGTPEPAVPGFPDRPPIQVARCPYDRAELVERFTRILEGKTPRLEVEGVERAFGLPRMLVSDPDPSSRSVRYQVKLRGGRDGDEWIAFIYFGESYAPVSSFRRPRLKGNGRPVPIDPSDRGSIELSLNFREDTPKPGTPNCIPVSIPYDRAVRAGWYDEPESAGFADDGDDKSVVLERGDMSYFPGVRTRNLVASRAEIEDACFSRGLIEQKPTRPEPSLSASERAQIERGNRETRGVEEKR